MICKILERLIKYRMVDFLIKLISTWIPKARSCLTNMLCFFEEITKRIDEGSQVDIIYLDFQKALDKVPHQRWLTGMTTNYNHETDAGLDIKLLYQVAHWYPLYFGIFNY